MSATQTQNGKGTVKVVPAVSPSIVTSQPSTAPATAIPTLPMPFQNEAYEIGKGLALASGSQKSVQSDRDSVEAACRAGAQMMDYSPYDAQNNTADKLAEEAIVDVKETRAHVREKKDHAGRALRDKKRAKAALPPTEQPALPAALIILSALLIGMSITPTFHDRFFFGIDDLPLRWFFSAVTAAVVGFLLAMAGLRYLHVRGGKSEIGWLNGFFLSSFLVAIALGVIRLTTGDLTWPAIYFAIGLTALEAGVLLILHYMAKPFRAAYREYVERTDAHSVADAETAEAAEYYDSLDREEAQLQAAVDRHIEHVRARDYCHQHPDRVEDAWVKYGLFGYDTGIAENRLKGVVP